MRRKLTGTFQMEPGPGHREKLGAQLSLAGVKPPALDAELRRVLALLAKTTLEISEGTITTRQDGAVVGVDRYLVRSETESELVVVLTGAPKGHEEQRFVQRDDGAFVVSSPELGSLVLKRR